jgi:hypothetical protein
MGQSLPARHATVKSIFAEIDLRHTPVVPDAAGEWICRRAALYPM